VAREVGDRDAEGDVLQGHAEWLVASGREAEALAPLARARVLHHAVGAVRGEADDVHATGRTLRALGRWSDAQRQRRSRR
jgi:hypothetical protein